MSGGHFGYVQCRFDGIIESLDSIIYDNNTELAGYIDDVYHYDHNLPDDIIEDVKLLRMRLAEDKIRLHNLDYLLCGDYNEESYRKTLKEDLEKAGEG